MQAIRSSSSPREPLAVMPDRRIYTTEFGSTCKRRVGALLLRKISPDHRFPRRIRAGGDLKYNIGRVSPIENVGPLSGPQSDIL